MLYHIVVLATTSEIVYRDPMGDFYRLLANLQKKNLLAKGISSRCNMIDTIDIFLLTLTSKRELSSNSSEQVPCRHREGKRVLSRREPILA